MDRIDTAKNYLARARELSKQRQPDKLEQAGINFKLAINLLKEEVKLSQDKKYKQALMHKLKQIQSQLQRVEAHFKKQTKPVAKQSTVQTPKQNIPQHKQMSEDQKKLRISLQAAIVRQKPNVSWDQVSGLNSAKQALKEAIVLPVLYPQIFVGQRRPWRGILLYGPPGTGKTLLAKACATEMQGGTFLSVSASSLISKYVGESQKLIKYLFQLARENRPSVIFMDEIDSLASTRHEGANESARKVITELLVQMQGVGNSMEGVLVLGATNLPWELDPAIRRRFQKKIYIQLPDRLARMKIITNLLTKIQHTLSDKQIQKLADDLTDFSGSDISILVKDSIYVPLREVQAAKYFRQNERGYWVSAEAGEPGAKKIALTELPSGGKVFLRKVTWQDFSKASQRIKASVSKQSLIKYNQFTNLFGQRNI